MIFKCTFESKLWLMNIIDGYSIFEHDLDGYRIFKYLKVVVNEFPNHDPLNFVLITYLK
jgi:hypothetical protein